MRLPTLILLLLLTEGLVRLCWDAKNGVPGLVMDHPYRIEILAPNYDGYFSNQPLKINNLGFRDDREFQIEKSANTFRIIVLGDSVTFGDGVEFKDTWTYMLEQNLKKWNPAVDWQVWNLGVPGYDLSMQLRALYTEGPRFKPDLVIDGFYEHDLDGRDYPQKVGDEPQWLYRLRWFMRRHVYTYTQVRLWYGELLMARSRPDVTGELRMANLLGKPEIASKNFDAEHFIFKHTLPGAALPPRPIVKFTPTNQDFGFCERDVNEFKRLHAEKKYDLVFFINIAPDSDTAKDQFVDGPHNAMNQFFEEFLRLHNRRPASTFNAFWAYKPSEIPGSAGHGLASTNAVKAKVLFQYLSSEVEKIKALKGTSLQTTGNPKPLEQNSKALIR